VRIKIRADLGYRPSEPFHDPRPVVTPVTARLSYSHVTDITDPRAPLHSPSIYWSVGATTIIDADVGEHTEQRFTVRPHIARKRPGKQAPETIGWRLLEIAVYDNRCRMRDADPG
jgi:hypothetical protein